MCWVALGPVQVHAMWVACGRAVSRGSVCSLRSMPAGLLPGLGYTFSDQCSGPRLRFAHEEAVGQDPNSELRGVLARKLRFYYGLW